MEVKQFIVSKKRDFNIALSLAGVIPFLVFVYLLVVKVSSFKVFIGEIGYIMFCTMVIFLMGILVGRKMFWAMLKELIDKNRLAAISETTLALSHEINNPLLAVRGNLDLLESDFAERQISDKIINNRLDTIKTNCERIRQVTDKLAKLSKPVSETIHSQSKMINLNMSE